MYKSSLLWVTRQRRVASLLPPAIPMSKSLKHISNKPKSLSTVTLTASRGRAAASANDGPTIVLPDSLMEEEISRHIQLRSYGSMDPHREEEVTLREQLARDEQRVKALNKQIAASHQQIDKVVAILANFDARLSKLEEAIKPLHRKTNKLKTVHENIDQALHAIDRVLDIFNCAQSVEAIIKDGPAGNAREYIECVDKTTAAIDYLRAHRSFKSAQKVLKHLETLLDYALRECESYVKECFSKYSSALDPTKLDDDTEIRLMDDKRIQELRQFVQRLNEFGKDTYLQDYAQKRGEVQQQLVKKVLWEKRYGKNSTFADSLRVLLRLLDAERQLAVAIVGGDQWESAFGQLIVAPISFLLESAEGEKAKNTSKARETDVKKAGQLSASLFQLLDVWQGFSEHLEALRALVACGDAKLQRQLDNFVQLVCEEATKCLSEFEQAIAKDSIKSPLPSDGTVHALASNTLVNLKRLHELHTVVESLLPEPPSRKQTAVGVFYARVLHILRDNLEAKARKKEKKGEVLSTIFLMNNYNYVLKTLRSSDLMEYVLQVEPKLKQEYEELIEEQLAAYRDSWQRVVDCLLGGARELPAPSQKYSKKERGLIKARFDSFNSEFEQLLAVQRHYSIPDSKFRKKVRQANKANVIPSYAKFYQDYWKTPFTQNLNKYVKYTPEQLEETMDHFFDGADALEQHGRRKLFSFSKS